MRYLQNRSSVCKENMYALLGEDKKLDVECIIRPESNIPLYYVKVYHNGGSERGQTVNVCKESGELLYQYHALALWYGTNYRGHKDGVMLLRVKKNRYIFLENGIYEFKTRDKYPITHLFSEDSGVSGSYHSFAISASYVYDLHNKTAIARVQFAGDLNWVSISQEYTKLQSVSLPMKLLDDPEIQGMQSTFTCCLQ